jgi:hypothetical protein
MHAGGVSWQTTTTWKASTDPDFVAKMRRVLDLYDHPPRGVRVVCVDEFGPLNLQPRKGKAWRPLHWPRRLRATYTRPAGVMHVLAALDLATGRLFYRIRPRNAGSSSSTCSRPCEPASQTRSSRSCATTSPRHHHSRVRAWCQANRIELVFLPTYGSWLNWIEAEFAALRHFALNGTDHRTHAEQNTVTAQRADHSLAYRVRPRRSRGTGQ